MIFLLILWFEVTMPSGWYEFLTDKIMCHQPGALNYCRWLCLPSPRLLLWCRPSSLRGILEPPFHKYAAFPDSWLHAGSSALTPLGRRQICNLGSSSQSGFRSFNTQLLSKSDFFVGPWASAYTHHSDQVGDRVTFIVSKLAKYFLNVWPILSSISMCPKVERPSYLPERGLSGFHIIQNPPHHSSIVCDSVSPLPGCPLKIGCQREVTSYLSGRCNLDYLLPWQTGAPDGTEHLKEEEIIERGKKLWKKDTKDTKKNFSQSSNPKYRYIFMYIYIW